MQFKSLLLTTALLGYVLAAPTEDTIQKRHNKHSKHNDDGADYNDQGYKDYQSVVTFCHDKELQGDCYEVYGYFGDCIDIEESSSYVKSIGFPLRTEYCIIWHHPGCGQEGGTSRQIDGNTVDNTFNPVRSVVCHTKRQ